MGPWLHQVYRLELKHRLAFGNSFLRIAVEEIGITKTSFSMAWCLYRLRVLVAPGEKVVGLLLLATLPSLGRSSLIVPERGVS